VNSVHPAAGYSAAGKPRTQEEQEMDLKFQSTENADRHDLKHLSRKVGVSGMKIPLLGHKIEWNSKP